MTEYQINWNKRHGHPNDLSLVTAGWLAFGEDLRRLSICCPIELISSILPASITLGKLRELKIECPANIIRLLEYLAVRINSLRSLRSLWLVVLDSFETPPFDVSPCFHSFLTPPLQALTVHILFEGLSDPSTLARFINTHRNTPQHLALHPYGYTLIDRNLQEQRFREIFPHFFPIESTSLQLGAYFFSADSIARSIHTFSNTPTSLVSVGTSNDLGYFTYTEGDLIVSVFAHRPRATD